MEFLTELHSGSDAALDWLVVHYQVPVYGLVEGLLLNPDDAADVTHKVFLKAYRDIPKFRQDSSLRTWLLRIAVREALKRRRVLWRYLGVQDSHYASPETSWAALEVEDTLHEPDSHLARHAVRAALRGVAEVFRTAVILRDMQGLSYEDTAQILGVSVGTVKSRVLRGRRALREALEPILSQPKALAVRPRSQSHRTAEPVAS